jgi:hypothetical protein
LLATAAVFDAALVVTTPDAGTGGSNLLGGAIWAAVAMAILGAGQAAWLNASTDDSKVPDANPDAEWRRAMALLASGELQCWRSVEDELDERRLRRMNSTAFGRPGRRLPIGMWESTPEPDRPKIIWPEREVAPELYKVPLPERDRDWRL